MVLSLLSLLGVVLVVGGDPVQGLVTKKKTHHLYLELDGTSIICHTMQRSNEVSMRILRQSD